MNSQHEYGNYHPTNFDPIHESGGFSHRGSRGTPSEHFEGQYDQHFESEELSRGNVNQHSTDEVVEVITKKPFEKWSHEDDTVLCSAWFNHSTDCKRGTNQPGGVFWRKIRDEVNEFRPNCHRTLGSCKTHWTTISGDISKYAGAERKAISHLGSGTGPVDVRTLADQLFFDHNKGKFFKFHHCYQVCKGNHKFMAYYLTTKQSSPATSVGSGACDTDSPMTNDDIGTPHYPARPMGVKAAKCKASGEKGKGKSSDHMGTAESIEMHFGSTFSNATKKAEEFAEKERKKEEYNARQYEMYQARMVDQNAQREFLIKQSERDDRKNNHTTLNLLLGKRDCTEVEARVRDRLFAEFYGS